MECIRFLTGCRLVAVAIVWVGIAIWPDVAVCGTAGDDGPMPAGPATDATDRAAPSSQASAQGPWTPLLDKVVATVGPRTGLCLVVGSGSGELAAEMVRRSNFFVQVLEVDQAKLDLTRSTLDGTGLYGRRTAAEYGDLSRLPFPDYCANLDLKKYLETQFEASAIDARRWSVPLPRGILLVTNDKVLTASPGRLIALARADGKQLGQLDLAAPDAPLPDGIAAAEDQLFLVTAAGEVLGMSASSSTTEP